MGIDLTADDIQQLLEALIRNMLVHNYTVLERQLEAAADIADSKVREAVAEAAVDLYMAPFAGTALAEKFAEARARMVNEMVENRPSFFAALRSASSGLPSTRFTGPLNAIWEPERAWRLAFASPSSGPLRDFVRRVRGQFAAHAPIFGSEHTSWSDLDGRVVVLYGTPAASDLVAVALAQVGWQVEADRIAVGDHVFAGEHMVLITCCPHPEDPSRGVAVYTAHHEEDVVGLNDLHHGSTDWVVGRRAGVGYQPVARGNFEKTPDGKWSAPAATASAERT